MTVTVGINGFGRIGRCTLAHIAESNRNDVQVVAINATGPIETNAHLMRYDSIHGRFPGAVNVSEAGLDLGRGPIRMMSTYSPEELDWQGIDVVLECTGKFNDRDKAAVHLGRGAKRVLVSAPAKRADLTVVYGVNHRSLLPEHHVVSNASCTTNCLAPLAKVLNDTIGIESGIMTTIHSYTGDQPTLDRRHKDLYRARRSNGDDPDHDRGGQGDWRSVAGTGGQAGGVLDPGPDAKCQRGGPDLYRRKVGLGRQC
jgi:glyceraldehyde 3-phosphate dehydrogenase